MYNDYGITNKNKRCTFAFIQNNLIFCIVGKKNKKYVILPRCYVCNINKLTKYPGRYLYQLGILFLFSNALVY